jgi:GT2 family glycosyltransferase
VVKSFTDLRIRYYKTERNLRPPRSWNYAARLAVGSYFTLLPHDDILSENFLYEMLKNIEHDKRVGFVQCNFHGINIKSIKINESSDFNDIKFSNGIQALEWHLKNLRCNPAALLFDLNKMRNEGFWREDYWDDWALILRLAYKYGFSYTSQVYSLVRAHEYNLSNILAKEGRLGALYVIDQLFDIFSKTLPHTTQSLSIFMMELRRLSISIFITSIKLTLKGEIKKASILFKLSRKINPLIPFDFRIILSVLNRIINVFNSKKYLRIGNL